MRNVHHDVADADHSDMFPHLEWPVTKPGQPVEMINHILGVEHAQGWIPFDSDCLGSLSSGGEDNGTGA